MNDNKGSSWTCCQCGKEFSVFDFKIKSLLHPDEWVCEDCAIYEDEIWLESLHKKDEKATTIGP